MGARKEQIYSFSAILYAVSVATEIPTAAILSKSRNAEVVDARHILIALLSECGWYQARIARQLGITEASVSTTLDRFAHRCKYGGFIVNKALAKARSMLLLDNH